MRGKPEVLRQYRIVRQLSHAVCAGLAEWSTGQPCQQATNEREVLLRNTAKIDLKRTKVLL